MTAADQTTHSGVVPPAYQLLEGFLWGQLNWALAVFIALTGLGLASGLLLAATVIFVGDGPPEAIALPLLLGGILALRQARP